ncbi:hypothetical protein FSP39_015636 [Pinctada imbricata]|uniref:Uncharacterized protein n=1 Tax=Pinctada imbricata TaxID=66713 RepID=A0AA88YH44_PINIB|nr:hypothetical protein FSP39_015636 [Pinctada imbricata]
MESNTHTPLNTNRPRRTSKPTPPEREMKKLCYSDITASQTHLTDGSIDDSIVEQTGESSISNVYIVPPDMAPLPSSTQGSVDGQTNVNISLSSSDMEIISGAVCDYIVKNLKTILEPVLAAHFANYSEALEAANSKITRLKEENEDLKKQVDALDQYTRRNSLQVSGIRELREENTDDVITSTMSKIGVEISPTDIEHSHRVGSKDGGKTRPIIVKFSNFRVKRRILMARKQLDKNVYVNDDLTWERSGIAYKARKLVKQKVLNKTWTSNGKIVVIDSSGRRYSIETMSELDMLSSRTHMQSPHSQGQARTMSYAGAVTSGRISISSEQIPSLEGAVTASVSPGKTNLPEGTTHTLRNATPTK